jgi:hypothetical protein
MGNSRDDKATVVLNLEALKKEQQIKDNELKDAAEGLEFNTDFESTELEVKSEGIPVILFDFKSELFSNSIDLFPKNYQYKIITTLPELNNEIKKRIPQIIFFNYASDTVAINKLLAQLKAKFKEIKTVVVAKNLAPDKALAHQKTASGASSYLSLPFQTPKIQTIISDLNLKS